MQIPFPRPRLSIVGARKASQEGIAKTTGFDTSGAKGKHLKVRIDILADINSCSQKRSCGMPDSIKQAYVKRASMTSET